MILVFVNTKTVFYPRVTCKLIQIGINMGEILFYFSLKFCFAAKIIFYWWLPHSTRFVRSTFWTLIRRTFCFVNNYAYIRLILWFKLFEFQSDEFIVLVYFIWSLMFNSSRLIPARNNCIWTHCSHACHSFQDLGCFCRSPFHCKFVVQPRSIFPFHQRVECLVQRLKLFLCVELDMYGSVVSLLCVFWPKQWQQRCVFTKNRHDSFFRHNNDTRQEIDINLSRNMELLILWISVLIKWTGWVNLHNMFS